MNKKLKWVQEYLGEERFNRVLEIFGILGLELPNDFDVYVMNALNLETRIHENAFPVPSYIFRKFGIVLSDIKGKNLEGASYLELDDLGCLEISQDYSRISIKKDGIIYVWKEGELKETVEVFEEDRGNFLHKFSVILEEFTDGIKSSRILISGSGVGPTIESTIDTVSVEDKKAHQQTTDKIEDYYEFFGKILLGDSCKYTIPKSLQNPELLRKVVSMFKRPIDDMVYELTNEDQSWRFEREQNAERRKFDIEKTAAEKVYDDSLKHIESIRDNRISLAAQRRDLNISLLETKKQAYMKAREGNPKLSLQQKETPNE